MIGSGSEGFGAFRGREFVTEVVFIFEAIDDDAGVEVKEIGG